MKKLASNKRAVGLDAFKSNWNLTSRERASLDLHFLRSWTLQDLIDHMEIGEDGLPYIPLFHKDFKPIYDSADDDWSAVLYAVASQHAVGISRDDKMPRFWLSFRSGYADGVAFDYVIVQKDTSNGR